MDDKSLVQDEGVNAGSAQELDEPNRSQQPQPGDAERVRQGGRAEEAGEQPSVNDLDPSETEDSQLVGAPAERAAEPGQPHGSSGQDAGSID